jgi:hypothetical protein
VRFSPDPGQWAGFIACVVAYAVLAVRWRREAQRRKPQYRRVFLESPYAGDVEANLAYGRACVADCLSRGESAYGSHLLLTQPGILDDGNPAERAAGIAAGQAFLAACDLSVVYTDRGVSDGMLLGIAAAHRLGVPVEYRRLRE